ncbi:unnamed protein product [Rotaria sp. Silwood1]|nr:unnamed protein product [Rotaria sp. Silwood1]
MPGKFHTCAISDIFVLSDEATILSIVNINNAGPWSLSTPYLELMNRNGSTVQFSTSIIGDTSGQCSFGAKFIPYYNNSQGKEDDIMNKIKTRLFRFQNICLKHPIVFVFVFVGNAVVLMCSSFTFPGGDTVFFRLKIDPLASNITPIGSPLIFHSESSFARFSSQPVTINNDVYFLLNSYPSGSNNYSVGRLNLVDFTFETWPIVHSSNSAIFLDPHTGTFSNVAHIDKLLFSVPCSSQDLSSSIPEMLCTYKYSSEKKFILIGMNPIPNARSNRNLNLYSPEEQQWGLTITSDPVTWSVLIMNTQFTSPTNSSRDLIYGAILNDTDVILTYSISASISQVRNSCFYLATAHSRTNELVVQQLKFGEAFKRTPTIVVDSIIVSQMTTNFALTILFATKNYLFVLDELNIYRYAAEC